MVGVLGAPRPPRRVRAARHYDQRPPAGRGKAAGGQRIAPPRPQRPEAAGFGPNARRRRYPEPGRTGHLAMRSAGPDRQSVTLNGQRYSVGELRAELRRFEHELHAAGLKQTSVTTYVDRAGRFLKWLDGDYHPGARTSARSAAQDVRLGGYQHAGCVATAWSRRESEPSGGDAVRRGIQPG